MIEFSAASSKMVLTKFAPVPPTFANNGTCVPSGAIKTALRPESFGNATLSSTRDIGNLERAVEAGDGQRRVVHVLGRSRSPRGLSGRAVRWEILRVRRSSRSGP